MLVSRKIVDDGFEHILTVLQDKKCGGLRLHAAVRNGELRRCPIWTAFGKSQPLKLVQWECFEQSTPPFCILVLPCSALAASYILDEG